jgi:RNA polymerase sporulation-specific sigma factor
MKTARKRRNDPLNRGESLLTPIDPSDPEGLTVLDVAADETVNIEKDVIVQEESKWLDETLKKRLTELERSTYERYKDGYTYREIAVELIRTEKTIDNAIMRVRNKAKEIIKQYIVNVLAKDDYSGAEYLSRKCGIENMDEIINVYCISFFSFNNKPKK